MDVHTVAYLEDACVANVPYFIISAEVLPRREATDVLSFVWSAGRHVASADVPHGVDVVFTDRQAKRFPVVCFALARVLEVGGTLRHLRVARLGPNVLGVGCRLEQQ